MIGLSILAVLIIYIALAHFIIKHLKNKKLKYLVIAVFVLIPTGDYLLGRIYLQFWCAAEGGLKIYETADNVEGFLAMSNTQSADSYYFKYLKYKYLEKVRVDERGSASNSTFYFTYGEDDHGIRTGKNISPNKPILMYTIKNKPLGFIEQKYQIEKNASGKLDTANNIFYYTLGEGGRPIRTEKNISKSKYILNYAKKKKPFGLIEQQYRIEEIASSKLLSTATNYTFTGGWIIESLHLTGNFVHCPSDFLHPGKFLNDVLKPISNAKQGE